jgi:hypothetical protein
LGRLLSMSVVTAKVVAPGSEEARASEPAPIRRRVRSGKLRAQKLLRRAHDHDAFQASQIGAARQSGFDVRRAIARYVTESHAL